MFRGTLFFIGNTYINGAGDGDLRHVAWDPAPCWVDEKSPASMMGITRFTRKNHWDIYRENP